MLNVIHSRKGLRLIKAWKKSPVVHLTFWNLEKKYWEIGKLTDDWGNFSMNLPIARSWTFPCMHYHVSAWSVNFTSNTVNVHQPCVGISASYEWELHSFEVEIFLCRHDSQMHKLSRPMLAFLRFRQSYNWYSKMWTLFFVLYSY